MSINLFEFAVEQARRMSRTHDICGDCCAKIPAGGDLLCPSCRAKETAEAAERKADPYRYARVERCANHVRGCVGLSTGMDVLCVSCRYRKNQFQKAVSK